MHLPSIITVVYAPVFDMMLSGLALAEGTNVPGCTTSYIVVVFLQHQASEVCVMN